MKLIISVFLCLCSLSIFGQVGINTTNPKGILHVDAGVLGDIADDVVITNQGYVGVGTDSPTTRLDIRTNSSTKGFSLADGNQTPGKALMSDEYGNGTWRNIAGGWSASLSNGDVPYNYSNGLVRIPFTDSYLSIPGIGAVNAASGSITVPYTGTYRIRITGVCSNNRMSAGSIFIAYFKVLTNYSSEIFSPHCAGVVGLVDVSVGFAGSIKLSANSTLTIHLNQDNGAWANKILDAVFMVDFMY